MLIHPYVYKFTHVDTVLKASLKPTDTSTVLDFLLPPPLSSSCLTVGEVYVLKITALFVCFGTMSAILGAYSWLCT